MIIEDRLKIVVISDDCLVLGYEGRVRLIICWGMEFL